jgi:hypothetical protein
MFAIAASILDVLGDRTALPVVESAAGKLPDDPDTS